MDDAPPRRLNARRGLDVIIHGPYNDLVPEQLSATAAFRAIYSTVAASRELLLLLLLLLAMVVLLLTVQKPILLFRDAPPLRYDPRLRCLPVAAVAFSEGGADADADVVNSVSFGTSVRGDIDILGHRPRHHTTRAASRFHTRAPPSSRHGEQLLFP